MQPNVLLIGVGHHAKRIHLRCLKKLNLTPSLIIDLASAKESVLSSLAEHGYITEELKAHSTFHEHQSTTTAVHFLEDSEKLYDNLSLATQEQLNGLIATKQISHAILSTDSRAHYAYLRYLIPKGIKILTDKPITNPLNLVNDEQQVNKLRSEYQHLVQLSNKHNTPVYVLCQRRYDPRFQYIRSLISEMMVKYGIPVHHMQIYHCDGSFYTPHDMAIRENHPFKYGYGKLLFSGYHFYDLLSWLPCWSHLPSHKQPN
jgi:predicted dehydrogenase